MVSQAQIEPLQQRILPDSHGGMSPGPVEPGEWAQQDNTKTSAARSAIRRQVRMGSAWAKPAPRSRIEVDDLQQVPPRGHATCDDEDLGGAVAVQVGQSWTT